MIYCVISIPAEKARDIRKTFLNFVIPQRYGSKTQRYKHCNVSENLYQPKIPQILDAYVLQKVSHLPEGHKLSLTLAPLSVYECEPEDGKDIHCKQRCKYFSLFTPP